MKDSDTIAERCIAVLCIVVMFLFACGVIR